MPSLLCTMYIYNANKYLEDSKDCFKKGGYINGEYYLCKDEYEVTWNEIIKIGDDIILIDTRNKSI